MFLFVWLGCGGTPAVEAPPVATARNPDVVIITIDTTRADRIGAYGYKDARTPTMDRLAANGVRYTHATSTLPLTIPSHAAMFTGKWPFHLNLRENGDNLLADEFTTLAEHFQAAGYDTAASVAAFVTTRRWGFAQGFDSFYDEIPEPEGKTNYWHNERDGALVVDDALRWIEAHPEGTPVFMWVHLYDAHFPYVAHEGQPADLRARPYDAEIAYVDGQIDRLVAAMSGRETVFVVVADHGESFGAHGEATHGMYTYDATQHVPWIISGAGIKPAVVTTPVSTVGLAATVAHAVGLPPLPGVDVPAQPAAETTIYSESYQLSSRYRIHPHRTVVKGDYKLIALPKPELYHLGQDPGEKTNIADQHPEIVKELRAGLDAIGASAPTGGSRLDADTIAQLAALGYVSSGGDGQDIDPLTLPDPKDHAEMLAIMSSLESTRAGGMNGTIEALQKAVRLKPDALEPRMRQLPLLARADRREEARALVEETSALFPKSARVWVALSGMAATEGDREAALTYARKAIEADPMDNAAQEQIVLLNFELGRFEEGIKEGDTFIAANPKNYGLAAVLGRYHLGKRDYPTAARHLAVAVEAPDPRRGARTQLAWLAAAAGHKEAAYPLLEAEIKDYPRYFRAHKVLSDLYRIERDWVRQEPHLKELVRARPADANVHLALGQCQFNMKDYVNARRSLDEALALDATSPDVLLLHANLLAKEGKPDEGKAVFLRADAANTERLKKAGLPLVERATAASPEDLPDELPAAAPGGAAVPGSAPAGATPPTPAPAAPGRAP